METTPAESNDQTTPVEDNDQTTSSGSDEQAAPVENDGQDASAGDGDHFKTVVAILIAVVALLGALVAWRSAVTADNAGGADFAGLNAVLNAEQARAQHLHLVRALSTLYNLYAPKRTGKPDCRRDGKRPG